MRRPLFVVFSARMGGMGEVVLALLEDRPPDVVPALVLFEPGPLEHRARALGVATGIVPTGRGRQLWHWPRAARPLRAAIRAHRADVVFAHHAKSQLYAGPAARLEGVPVLWWQHSRAADQRLLTGVADRLPADLVICSSERHAAEHRRHAPSHPAVCVHPGTRVPAVPPAPVRAEATTVGFAGRLQRLKRVERLLHAAPRVLAARPQTRFVIIGGPPPGHEDYVEELVALARRLDVGHAVELTGDVPDAQERIGRLDLLAHTCDEESFGLVVVEAMARGVPAVVPDRGGTTESVRDGVDGLWVDVADAAAFADAIVALLADPPRRARMGAAGRRRVEERFTQEAMTARAWQLTREVAAGERHRGPGRRRR